MKKHKTKWKVKHSHPLVLLYDEKSPRDFYIEHLMESENKRVHFNIKKPCNILFKDKTLENHTHCSSSFEMCLLKKFSDDKVMIENLKLSLEKPFTKGNQLDSSQWTAYA